MWNASTWHISDEMMKNGSPGRIRMIRASRLKKLVRGWRFLTKKAGSLNDQYLPTLFITNTCEDTSTRACIEGKLL
jgi:hypothetical protein